MKRTIKFLILGLIIPSLLVGCITTEERELKGYKFNKEWAKTEPFSSDLLTGSITVDMYIMLHSYPTKWTTIVSKLESDAKNEFHLRLRGKDRAQWYFGDGNKAIVLDWIPEEVIPLNEWVRITAIRDRENKNMELLVNGQSAAKKTFRTLPRSAKTENAIILMAHGNNLLDATVADIRIWGKALSLAEINKTAIGVKKASKEKSLVAYWNFEVVENDVVRDLSGKNNDLSISKIKK